MIAVCVFDIPNIDITVVWKTFVVKQFRMTPPLRNLNARTLFHYEFFAAVTSI